MEIGDLVKINCDNRSLNKKIGTVVLNKKYQKPIYGLCVLIDGTVYGFEEKEVEVVNESR